MKKWIYSKILYFYTKLTILIRQLKLKNELVSVNFEKLIKDLKEFGIKKGDVVLVHSSLKSIGYVKGGPRTVIDAFIKTLGNEGTLLIPTYSGMGTMYQTCTSGYIFDVKKSKTNTGLIPTEFLKIKNVKRSIHPTHSVSGIGKYAKEITEAHHLEENTFGINSPWGRLCNLDGKIMGIGINLGSTTQYHHVEDIMGENFPLNVKVNKIFNMKCYNNEGNIIEIPLKPLDPEVAKTRIDKAPNSFIRDYYWEIFEELGLLNTGYIGKAFSWWINAEDFIKNIIKLAKIGITIYSTKEDLISNELYPFDLIKKIIRS